MPRSRGDESGTNDDGKRGCRALPLAAFLLSDDVHDEGEFAGGRLIPTTTSLLVPSGSRAAIAVDLGGSEQRMAAWQSGSCSPSAARPYNPRCRPCAIEMLDLDLLLYAFLGLIFASVWDDPRNRLVVLASRKFPAAEGRSDLHPVLVMRGTCSSEASASYHLLSMFCILSFFYQGRLFCFVADNGEDAPVVVLHIFLFLRSSSTSISFHVSVI
ncbi:Os11g0307500 [Oryza sativa Japonica Group]|jgi:hypothetical protein|uniref:Expressed protein n=2 Tax=Oryza sativa subsp. japonica TaxID=39947 RepID=Q2R6G1_ORYSJ|nr:expressed protein [Oryza sativa Japonica Group]KAB8115033.1 hypothetical protein EE612_054992 [Oryza sativa]KAF2910581.1 hypothetical protein DAI22_11g111000 [Oryza sativa Japonica Group]BAF28113.1 Os11g0307500 [Oryza sativa Japonica Group]BAT13713.1 Os11g0307500 [Oryza sativa Japonica Group]|eukprot:NP_001067750.1 Os11g0307500 [Oryza sativa Japonica Group]